MTPRFDSGALGCCGCCGRWGRGRIIAQLRADAESAPGRTGGFQSHSKRFAPLPEGSPGPLAARPWCNLPYSHSFPNPHPPPALPSPASRWVSARARPGQTLSSQIQSPSQPPQKASAAPSDLRTSLRLSQTIFDGFNLATASNRKINRATPLGLQPRLPCPLRRLAHPQYPTALPGPPRPRLHHPRLHHHLPLRRFRTRTWISRLRARQGQEQPGTAWTLQRALRSMWPSSAACGAPAPRRSPRPTTRACLA